MNPFTITTMEIYTIKVSRVFHFSTSYTIKASIFYHSRVLCSSLLPISHLCIQNLRSSSIFRSGKVNVWFRDGFWPGERWRWHNFNAGTVCVAIWVKECVLKWLFYRRTLPTRFGKHRGFAFVEYVNQTRDEKRPSSSLYQTLIFMDTIRRIDYLHCAYEGNGEDVQTFAAGDSSPPAAANGGGATEEFSDSKSQQLRVWCRLPMGQWELGNIQSAVNGKASVTLLDGTVMTVSTGELVPANSEILDGVDNLVALMV
ncbi:hypothetical protein HanRHA438_Chr15g0692221 [Helianthus annuus]|nr:hypothetical protein HanRHA438_Chr15g0692221 [Helianthus annuus]